MLISKFPENVAPRPAQIDLISKIEKAFTETDVIICCAPTGTGKSFLAKTLANNSENFDPEYIADINSYRAYKADYSETWPNRGATVLTITKSLQDQYSSLFEDCEILKGKSNYICDVDPNLDVETAPCVFIKDLKSKCWAANRCPYYEQRNKALTSKFSALNYNMFFALPQDLKHREYLICDEASEIEDQLVKHFTINISLKTIKFLSIDTALPGIANYNTFYKWLTSFSSIIKDLIQDYKNKFNSKNKNEKDAVKFKILSRLNDKVNLVLETWERCQYVLTKDGDSVTATPLYVNTLASEIFKYGKKILLMSATIIDPQNFAKSLGLENYRYIESPSPFDPAKAPIFISSKYKLNYNNLNTNLPKVIDLVQEICDSHSEDKGVIHTHTGFITNALKTKLKGDRFQYRYEEVTNEQLIAEHINADFPSVLVSPSITHGVDLKDDLARFQIIVKLPFLPLGDVRIKKIFETDPKWYTNKMLSSLVQASGRGIRSQEDWCVTYILDGGAGYLIKKSKDILPKFFLDRVQ